MIDTQVWLTFANCDTDNKQSAQNSYSNLNLNEDRKRMANYAGLELHEACATGDSDAVEECIKVWFIVSVNVLLIEWIEVGDRRVKEWVERIDEWI